jgi:Secretion system C-terminal sorting domain
MKKITLFLFMLFSIIASSQIKTTGELTFVSGLVGELTLNNGTATATLTLKGPSNRWIAFKLGSFTTAMSSSPDGIYYNGTTVVDGNGGELTTDAVQNWTLVSNEVNASIRTIIATRPFSTGDTNDFTINFADTNIDVAAAFGETDGSFNLEYHGANKGKFLNTSLSTLGVEDFSLNATQVYPNPSNGEFLVKAKTTLEQVNIYTQTGALVKTIKVEESSDASEINVNGLQTGVYLLELVNATEKSWKKIIVN